MTRVRKATISNETVLRFKVARQEAAKLGAEEVEVPHLLLAIALDSDTPESDALAQAGLTEKVIRMRIIRSEGRRESIRRYVWPSKRSLKVREQAKAIVENDPKPFVQPKQLLLAAIQSDEGKRFIGGPQVMMLVKLALAKRREDSASAPRIRHA